MDTDNLLQGYLNKTLSREEKMRFLQFLTDPGKTEEVHQLFSGFLESELAQSGQTFSKPDPEIEKMLQYIYAWQEDGESGVERAGEDTPVIPVTRSRRNWIWAAAAAVLLIFFFIQLYRSETRNPEPPAIAKAIPPGGNRAFLTLSDGSRIALDQASNGTLVNQGTSTIQKPENGRLIYSNGPGKSGGMQYNTLATPRAGQYQLQLPDGSKVWLNNATKLTYPVAFDEGTRTVQLSGEAYFEIAADPHKPFHIKTNGQDITVLGTSLNVNCFSDESAERTTLVEGKVKVVAGSETLLLEPGSQASLSGGGLALIHPDIRSIIAWKRGFFNFSNADVYTIMRQIARWYDVTVEYQGTPPGRTFDGNISRNENLADVIKILNRLKINATLAGRKIIILP